MLMRPMEGARGLQGAVKKSYPNWKRYLKANNKEKHDKAHALQVQGCVFSGPLEHGGQPHIHTLLGDPKTDKHIFKMNRNCIKSQNTEGT